MEYNMELVLLSELYRIYGVEESDTSMNLLYHYLYIRAGIKYNSKKVSKEQLMKFIFEELNITKFSSVVIYNDVEYNANKIAKDFIDDLEFRANLEGEVNIKKIQEEIYNKGYKKAVKYRKSNYYKTHIKYSRLLELNKYFYIEPQAKLIDGFKTDKNHNPYQRTLEEQWQSIMDADKILSNTTQYITEEDLENYIVENLHLIESGLVYQDRQVVISGGIIDILAKDKNGKLTIIELKINDDKSLIWQTLHYPKEISKLYRVDQANIRMLTIAPSYKKSILETLNNIEGVEIYRYSIQVSLGEIMKLRVYRSN